MGIIEKINRFLQLYLSSLGALRRPLVILPLIVYALIQYLVLIVLENYNHPAIFPWLSSLVSLTGQGREEFFSHYPELYILLPNIYQWAKLAVGFLLEALFLTVTVVLFVRHFNQADSRQWPLSLVWKRWPTTFAVWAIVSILLVIINIYIPGFFAGYLYGSPRRAFVFDAVMKVFTVGVYSLFLYALPAAIVYNNGLIKSLKTSLTFFVRYPIFTFFLAFIPYILSLPLAYATAASSVIVDKFSPGLVVYLLIAGIFVDLIINYFLTGTAVRFLLQEAE